MRNLKSLLGFLAVAVVMNKAYSQELKVELPGTQVLKFTSAIDTQQYILHINLPENYGKTNKRYPVLYITDGQWFFPSMYVGYGGQHYDGFLPDLILVGITWPDNYAGSRGRDFTPNRVEGMPGSGNAGPFLSVIKNEVIKLIDSAYRTDQNDRALYGTSLGGLFALYTLFHESTLFNRYIIISPALQWDNEILFKYEKKFAETNRPLNAKIFISYGEYEEPFSGNVFNRFVTQLKSRKYRGLEMESMKVARMGHSGSGTVGGIIGLQYVYSKPALKLDTGLLNQYAGRYALDNESFTIMRSGYNLDMQTGTVKFKLFAEAPGTFYTKGLDGKLQFKKDDKGKVTGYDLIRSDTTVFFKKVK